MLKKVINYLFILVIFSCLPTLLSAEESSPRVLIHILDYLAQDYAGAVDHGKVLNEFEYQEQTEFVSSALKIAQQLEPLKNNPTLLGQIQELKNAVDSKESPLRVSELARSIQGEVIKISKIEMAPREWPNLNHAKNLFDKNCTTCHGSQGLGDGPLAKTLIPPPANFYNEKKMMNLSPFQIFNTVRLGIQGTSMTSFPKLSDQEVWELSFYVLSLRYQNNSKSVSFSVLPLSLEQISKMSDAHIIEQFHLSGLDEKNTLADLRLRAPATSQNTLSKGQKLLEESLESYQNGDLKQAKQQALMAYLEGVEPVEPKLKGLDPALVSQLETKMFVVRGAIDQNVSREELKLKIEEAKLLLIQADQLLSSSAARSQWFVFLMAFTIILREGFEAVLILITILGVVKMLGAKKAVAATHAGWIAALLLGVIAWFFSGWLMGMSGANRESMEGFTSLFAVIVLLYVGFWLHSKSEIGKWTAFIKEQMNSALEGSRLVGIGMISFVAVFREVFETVLFLRALWLEAGANEKSALLAGLGVSFVLIFILAYLLLQWSVKLPIGKLFNISSFVMTLLAIILTGKGLHSLQEAGYISMTLLTTNIKFPLLGVFPTLETLISQVVLLALIILIWGYGKKSQQISEA